MTRLAVGGAQETALATCVRADRTRFEQILVVGPERGSEGNLFDEAERLGVRMVVISSLVRPLSPVRDAYATYQLVRALRDLDPAIVHTHSSKAGILGRVAARLARCPIVVHSVHGWSFHDHLSKVSRQCFVALERTMARLTSCFVVESDSDREKGLDLTIGRPDQYVTIRNGIDLGQFGVSVGSPERRTIRDALGLPADALIVGTVIRLVAQKDPELLVCAAAIVVAEQPKAHFVIVGDGPLREQTAALTQQLGISTHVHLTGIRRDVAELLASFDLFALSSRWEGLPRVVLEAMAIGIPIVAPDVDGLAEAITDGVTGRLVRPQDPLALATGILDLLHHPGTARQAGRAGRSLVEERFDLRRMITEIEDLYTRLDRETSVKPRAYRGEFTTDLRTRWAGGRMGKVLSARSGASPDRRSGEGVPLLPRSSPARRG